MSAFPPEKYEALSSHVPGVEVYRVRSEAEQHQAVVSFICPKCGGNRATQAGGGGLSCLYCGHHSEPSAASTQPFPLAESVALIDKHEFRLDLLDQARESWAPGEIDLDCGQCGAHITLPPQQLTHVCPFCHSQQVIQQKRREDALSPQALIPLAVQADRCAEQAQAWLGGHWLLPRDLRTSV